MTKRNDGGPAFQPSYDMSGISLRDWFAGLVLHTINYNSFTDEHLAWKAYDLADAMMAAREPKP